MEVREELMVTISPLELLLDEENPRFVVLPNRDQAALRKYLLTYEDVSQLARAINDTGSLLPGERIVALKRGSKYVVIEGNRRVCSLQMLLSRDLIPKGFEHRIPAANRAVLVSCGQLEIDVVPNRAAAIALMSKRHIDGVKQWKALAKKRFFTAYYSSGQSVQALSEITGISESTIKGHIKEYKFFLDTYQAYLNQHPDFEVDVVDLKPEPFWRLFKAAFEFHGEETSSIKVLRMSVSSDFVTTSSLKGDLFFRIVQLVFEEAIVKEKINTRNVLTDVDGIMPLLEEAIDQCSASIETTAIDDTGSQDKNDISSLEADADGNYSNDESEESDEGEASTAISSATAAAPPRTSGGPVPGGPAPNTFFETISWIGKLSPTTSDHLGLIVSLDELYRLSTTNCGRQKAYQVFPNATGMVLRTVYEQALIFRLKQISLWATYHSSLRSGAFPQLSGIESHVASNLDSIFSDNKIKNAFRSIQKFAHRDFLNANIHAPGNIRVTADALNSIAAAGMYSLIQGIIDLA